MPMMSVFNVDVRIERATELAGHLEAGVRGFGRQLPTVVRRNGRELQDRVRKNASGRPGPNKITGDYWRSIKYRVMRFPSGLAAEVYSNAPQAYRLEYGFVDVDSLGRHYNQPPFPHFRPALRYITPIFFNDVRHVIARSFK